MLFHPARLGVGFFRWPGSRRSLWLGRTSVSLCAGFADAAFGDLGRAAQGAFFQMMIMVADFPSAKYLSTNNSLFSCHRVDLVPTDGIINSATGLFELANQLFAVCQQGSLKFPARSRMDCEWELQIVEDRRGRGQRSDGKRLCEQCHECRRASGA